jgi:hypothetical protein
MKTLKQYIKEATVGKPAGPSTIHQDTVEDGVISAANIHDAETLKKVNAFVGAIGDGEYLTPQAAIHGLREKLMRIGLQFGDVETPGKSGSTSVEVMQFGGRFGKDLDGSDINDDGISHRKEGGLKVNFKYESNEKGSYKVFAELV